MNYNLWEVVVFRANMVVVILLALSNYCFARGLDAQNYSLADNFSAPLLIMTMGASSSQTTTTIGIESSGISPELQKTINGGKTLGTLGTIFWGSGKLMQVVGLSMLMHYDDAGLSWLLTGTALDLFGPISSCIGEASVMSAMRREGVRLQGNYFQIRPKGWGYYGTSWAFTGIGIIANLLGVSSGIQPLALVGSIAGVVGEVYRGISAIAPLVRVNRASSRIHIQARPILDSEGRTGMALSCSF